MAGLAELSAAMMVGAERRIDVTAANIANISTPGFRASRVFASVLDNRAAIPSELIVRGSGTTTALRATGNPLDIASDAASLFLLRSGGQTLLTRSVQLRRDADGRLIDVQGRAIQAYDGGDVIVGQGKVSVLPDGVVLVDGQPEARIGLFSTGVRNGDDTSSANLNDRGQVYSGMIAPSDVDLANEMTEMTRAGRLAETGARVFQIYDDLMSQVTRKFAEGGR